MPELDNVIKHVRIDDKILNCGIAFTTKDAEKKEILSDNYDDRFYFYLMFLTLVGSVLIAISSLVILKNWILS